VRWTCHRCGQEHEGVPLDWSFDGPAYWDGPRAEGDYLAEDACVWTDDDGGRAFFVRGFLEIAIEDSEETLGYGVWSSLSERSFERVLALWDDPARTSEPPYFGWLSNSLPGYPETLNLPLDVVTADLAQRPDLRLHSGDHPLVLEQERGIVWERVLELAELNLHPGVE
jgi:hypothetical protein